LREDPVGWPASEDEEKGAESVFITPGKFSLAFNSNGYRTYSAAKMLSD